MTSGDRQRATTLALSGNVIAVCGGHVTDDQLPPSGLHLRQEATGLDVMD